MIASGECNNIGIMGEKDRNKGGRKIVIHLYNVVLGGVLYNTIRGVLEWGGYICTIVKMI